MNRESKDTYKPLIYRTENKVEMEMLMELRKKESSIMILDEMTRQLKELARCRHPTITDAPDKLQEYIGELLQGRDLTAYGTWVYYPWRKTLVHLLDEKEFIEVRTNRNQLKITREEQSSLSSKTIGIIGLSVGQSIALTMAMERTCGTLLLADFDELDLSNLNRLRTGVFNLAVPKVIIAAREIAEIDPFLQVEIFPDGLHKDNYDCFLNPENPIDLLVEVCDSFDVKLESRLQARKFKIPVVMDTNDRGMLDVERFDIEPDRPVFHGLVGNLTVQQLTGLSAAERLGYLMQVAGAEHVSDRMKQSIPEIRRTLLSWPQLASDVVLGGAITTHVCRRILLGQPVDSGRYYIDMENLIGASNN